MGPKHIDEADEEEDDVEDSQLRKLRARKSRSRARYSNARRARSSRGRSSRGSVGSTIRVSSRGRRYRPRGRRSVIVVGGRSSYYRPSYNVVVLRARSPVAAICYSNY